MKVRVEAMVEMFDVDGDLIDYAYASVEIFEDMLKEREKADDAVQA